MCERVCVCAQIDIRMCLYISKQCIYRYFVCFFILCSLWLSFVVLIIEIKFDCLINVPSGYTISLSCVSLMSLSYFIESWCTCVRIYPFVTMFFKYIQIYRYSSTFWCFTVEYIIANYYFIIFDLPSKRLRLHLSLEWSRCIRRIIWRLFRNLRLFCPALHANQSQSFSFHGFLRLVLCLM